MTQLTKELKSVWKKKIQNALHMYKKSIKITDDTLTVKAYLGANYGEISNSILEFTWKNNLILTSFSIKFNNDLEIFIFKLKFVQ